MVEMMPFTDDNLKQLKYIIEWEDTYVRRDDILEMTLKLLARLEAAEKVCDMVEITADIYTNMKVLEAVKAWRKAAGK